jgi:hypothetical protein
MPNKTNRGRSQDRDKVAGGQEHEINYEKNKMNVSSKEVKNAIKKAGNQRENVEKNLKK